MNNPRSRSLPAGLPDLDRCAVMGVVNVTPDSFSDGGLWHDPARAIAHGLALRAKGADLVDVGGESTRPGARRVTEKEELERVLPVVRELAGAGVVVSIDTMRASVAEQAVAAGARLVNDVSGGLADPEMAAVVAATGAPFVVMHWRGQSADMERLAVYGDVVADVVAELTGRMEALLAAGVQEQQLILDPGLGFAKTTEHNWALLGRLDALTALGRPVLVAASRKRFLGTLLANPETGELRPARERDDATAAVSVLSAGAGAWAVRVHDVAGTADAVRVVAAWQRAARQG
ncbi:dihydropteroate synthase [Kitasatospora sp. NBC_00240]|uniref:dihydropteroate synthase n=1 Tax=Kitasatospora sp. NBC_00240 TaxID=2903567 RepID=UPI0022508A19|nr:dihydropteroate synthase [Kitasatospora sp. NBC_00240]MCX5211339.1 dihydropteroate synthase [Kitasatospora sp. NBC_00240]